MRRLQQFLSILFVALLLALPAAGISLTKTTNAPSPAVGSTISFILNVTNNDAFNYSNYTLIDNFNTNYFSFVGANVTPKSNSTNGSLINFTWEVNLTNTSSYLVEVNLTTLQAWTTANNATILDETNTTGATSSQSVTIQDVLGPTSNITAPENNTVSANKTPYLVFNLTDDTNTTINYTIYVDGSANGQSGQASNDTLTSLNLTALTNGTHELIVEATDGAGNQGNSSSITYLVDQFAPSSSINTINGTNYTDTTPNINFTLTDNLDNEIDYVIYVDGSANGQAGTAVNDTIQELTLNPPLTQGNHTITVQAADNVSFTTNSTNITITIDSLAPLISAVVNISTNESFEVNWTTDEPADSSLSWGADTNVGNSTSDAEFNLSHRLLVTGLAPDTLYYYNITTCDRLGQCNTSTQRTVTTQANPECYAITSDTTLTEDIENNGTTCFTMATPSVTLDCGDYHLQGNNTPETYGIHVTAGNLSIQNCNVSGFAAGIFLDHVENVNITDYTSNNAANAILFTEANQTLVYNFTFTHAGNETAVTIGGSSNNFTLINGQTTGQKAFAVATDADDGNTFDCAGGTISSDDAVGTYGFRLSSGDGATIKNCTVVDFQYGIYIASNSDGHAISDNNISSSSLYGIEIADAQSGGSTIDENEICGSATTDVDDADSNTWTNNTCDTTAGSATCVLACTPPANVTVTKTALNATPLLLGDTVSYRINVSNNDAQAYENYTLYDIYSNITLIYDTASPVPKNVLYNGSSSELEWEVNLSASQNATFEVNFTTNATGSVNNSVEIEDEAELQLDNYDTISTVRAPWDLTVAKAFLNGPVQQGQNASFRINISSTDDRNAENFTLADIYDNASLAYVNANPLPKTTLMNGVDSELRWEVNVTAGGDTSIEVNFTTLSSGTQSNEAELNDTTGRLVNDTETNFSVQPPPGPAAQAQKFASTSTVDVNSTVQFVLNVTNLLNRSVTDWTVTDNYTTIFLNYTWANKTPRSIDYALGEVTWRFNLSINETKSVRLNLTGVAQTGGTTNYLIVKNATEQLASGTADVTVNAPGSSPGQQDSYTAMWSNAQPAQYFNDYDLFSFSGSPYVVRGDGCYRDPQYSNDYSTPGENCCSGKSNDGGDGCNGNGDITYDLGAVWVEQVDDFIGWKIVGPYTEGANNLSVCDGLNRSMAVVVEFDFDNNQSTGCDPNNESCYPGADYQMWFFPDDNTTLFASYNDTVQGSAGAYGISFEANTTISANDMWVWYNCSATENKARGIHIIVNKTAVFGNRTPKLNFETNSFNTTEATTNPLDLLTDFGGSYDSFLYSGPGPDAGACFQWDGTNESTCENNTDSLACQWTSFPDGTGLCDPDFDNFVDGASCFTLDDQSSCEDNANNGVGYCTWEPGITQPNGTQGLCIEEFKPFEFGGGDCQDNCFNCFGEAQCNGSNANGGSEYGGCRWYTDYFNPNGWCDVKDLKTGCSENPAECYLSADCSGAGWHWNTTWEFCLREAGKEICFNGVDDDNDALIDCDDPNCDKSRICGGHINTLTGTYKGYDPEIAMQEKFLIGMGPVLQLKADTPGDNADQHTNINGFGVVISTHGIGMGMMMENLSDLVACGGATEDRRSVFFVDNDATETTGCNVTVDGTPKDGWEYMIKYGNYTQVNESAGEALFYACYQGAWVVKEAAVDPVIEPGDPFDPMSEETPIECGEDMQAIALQMEKADIGNPTGDIRFMGIIANGSYTNESNLSSSDTIDEIYYTPGTMNFEPIDCFEEPTKCGSDFIVIGGGEFMPLEDCLEPGDEDADGAMNCADTDCAFAPQCAGQYDASTDKTRPKVKLKTVKTFDDAAFVKWVTNEPTRGKVLYYNTDNSCETLNGTHDDLGDPTTTFDDLKPWHEIPLDPEALGAPLSPSTTYYYKLNSTDPANNSAISACLNFTTQGTKPNVSLVFNYTANGTPDDFLGNLSITINGTELKPGGSSQFTGGISNVNMTVRNPTANDTVNWSITLVNIDFNSADVLDFSNEIVGDASGDEGDYVGMEHGEWLNVVQKLGADYLVLRIPETGDELRHCLNNGTNCTDVSDTEGVQKLGEGVDYTEWKVPTTLGFSSYSAGDSPTYTLNYTNLTDATVTAEINTNATLALLVNNTMTTSETYNFTLDLPTNVLGWVNDSVTLSAKTIPANDTTRLTLKLEANETGAYTVAVHGILANDSSTILNSSQDLTITLTVSDLTAPVITGPTNHTFTETTAIINWTTDEAANRSVAYGTTLAFGSTMSNATLSTTHSFSLSGLNPSTTYHYNVTSCDASGNCANAGPNNFTTTADITAPSVTLVTPPNATNTSSVPITINCSASDLIALNNITLSVWNGSSALDYNNTVAATGTSDSAQWSFTPTSDGNYTWNCRAGDTSDNHDSAAANRSFTYDTTAPSTTDDAPTGWQTSAFNVTLTPSDSGVGTSYTTYLLDGASATNGTTIEIATEGNYTITYYSVDALGNAESANTAVAALDLVAPSVDLTTPADNAVTDSTITYQCNASDTINLTSLTLLVWNSSGALDYTNTTTSTAGSINGEWNVTPSTDGTFTWNCRATDVATRLANDTANRTVTYDTTVPTSTISSPANNTYTSDTTPTITFTLTDELDTTIAYAVFVDGSSDATGTATNNTATNVTLSTLTTGSHSVRVEATDDAGNTVNSSLLNLTVDTTSPVLNITTPTNGTTITRNWTLINWTVTESNIDTSQLNVDYGWYTTTTSTASSSVNVTNLTAGLHRFTVTTNDTAGNTDSGSREFFVDAAMNFTNFTGELESDYGISDTELYETSNNSANLTANDTVDNLTGRRLSLTFTPLVVTGLTPQVAIENFLGNNANYNARFRALDEDNSTNSTIIGLGSTPVQLLSLIDVANFVESANYNGSVTFNTSDINYTYVYWCTGENGTGCTQVSQCGGNDPNNYTGSTACYTNTTTNTTVYTPHFSSVVLSLDNIVGNITVTEPINHTPLTNGSAVTLAWTASEAVTGNFTLALGGEAALMMNATDIGSAATSFSASLTSNQTQNVLPNGSYTVTFYLKDGANNTDEVNFTFNVSDSSGPTLGTPSVSSVTTSAATISVTADEYTTITVNYGTTSGSLGSSSSASSYSFTPRVSLTGLSEGTTYYYEVVGSDVDGRSTTTAESSFTTDSTTTTNTGRGGGGGGSLSTSYATLGSNPVRVTLNANGNYNFYLSGDDATYEVRVTELPGNDNAKLYFPDSGEEFLMAEGESERTDITQDGSDDVEVTIISASLNSVSFTLQAVAPAAPPTEAPTVTEPELSEEPPAPPGPGEGTADIIEPEPAAEQPAPEEQPDEEGGNGGIIIMLIAVIMLLLVLGWIAVKKQRLTFE